jgi:hypothetical protein
MGDRPRPKLTPVGWLVLLGFFVATLLALFLPAFVVGVLFRQINPDVGLIAYIATFLATLLILLRFDPWRKRRVDAIIERHSARR